MATSLLQALDGSATVQDVEQWLRVNGWAARPELSEQYSWPAYRDSVLRVSRALSDERDAFRKPALTPLFAAKLARLGPPMAELLREPSDTLARRFSRERVTAFATSDGWLGLSTSVYEFQPQFLGGQLLLADGRAWARLLAHADVRVCIHLGALASVSHAARPDHAFALHRRLNVALLVRAHAADLAPLPRAQQLLLSHDAADVARALVREGLPADYQLPQGTWLLGECAARGLAPSVRLLLDAGADADLKDGVLPGGLGEPGATALEHASIMCRVECVRLLAPRTTVPVAPYALDAVVEAFSDAAFGERRDEGTRALDTLRTLLAAGATPALAGAALMDTVHGAVSDPRCLALLLAQRADPDTPLVVSEPHGAALTQRLSALEWLCRPEYCSRDERPAARELCALPLVRLLAAHGASRRLSDGTEAEDVAPSSPACAFLRHTRGFTTPLHFAQWLPVGRVRALLLGGASAHAQGAHGTPTPLELAEARADASDAQLRDRAVATLMRHASRAWAPGAWPAGTHDLFAAPTRARVPFLLWVGAQMSAQARFTGVPVHEAWCSHVLPRVLGTVGDSFADADELEDAPHWLVRVGPEPAMAEAAPLAAER